jgi:hypothetical protein
MVALPLVQLAVRAFVALAAASPAGGHGPAAPDGHATHAGLQSRSAPERASDLHSPGVNLVAGDLSVLAGYVPAGLPAPLDERARVQGHLRFAHDLLARVDTAGWPTSLRTSRERNLERLAVYAAAGHFPYNDDHPDAHRPTFVDRDGTLCAVGALFAADRGRATAERIARSFKYAFIAQITDGELAIWQQSSGLAPEELALIQPSYDPRPETTQSLWLPFGLLDRMQIAPFRASVTTESGTADHFATSSMTLHAQWSTPCDCRIGAYGTLPVSILLDDDAPGVAASGGPLPDQQARTVLGTADVGLFGGTNKSAHGITIFRVGALLPTGARHPHRWLPSARVGDAVLELPRSAGVRLSTSKLMGWHTFPSGFLHDALEATRFDLGVDVAVELVGNTNPVHVVPRAGIGSQLSRGLLNLAIDTSLSVDPFVDDSVNLRWSTGLTGRLAFLDGTGWFLHPAFSLAAVRTIDGWSANLLFDLAATGKPHPSYSYNEG